MTITYIIIQVFKWDIMNCDQSNLKENAEKAIRLTIRGVSKIEIYCTFDI